MGAANHFGKYDIRQRCHIALTVDIRVNQTQASEAGPFAANAVLISAITAVPPTAAPIEANRDRPGKNQIVVLLPPGAARRASPQARRGWRSRARAPRHVTGVAAPR
jgi:hypothetical protein